MRTGAYLYSLLVKQGKGLNLLQAKPEDQIRPGKLCLEKMGDRF